MEAAKKEKPPQRIGWVIDHHTVEILRPKEIPGCCETSMQGGVFVDGKEILPPGLLRERVGFVYEQHHYQIMHNRHTFANAKGKKGGKFILLVDGWEADTRTPLNKFFLWMYTKVLIVAVIQLAISVPGVLAMFFDKEKKLPPIVSGIVSKILIVFLPLSLYYIFIGAIGVGKYFCRLRLDEKGEPWWEHEDYVDPTQADADDNGDDDDGGERGGGGGAAYGGEDDELLFADGGIITEAPRAYEDDDNSLDPSNM